MISQNGSQQIEEGTEIRLDFDKLASIGSMGLSVIPAVAQDVESGEVLIVAYANREALEYTLKHRIATFWSTSRNELWVKGKGSGDLLDVDEVRVNCEQNSILYRVRLRGKGACHTKDESGHPRKGCFYRRVTDGKLEPIGREG
jgi:phosphoribosyl-AMP cyclohydrolase